jgi:hypothetical protein
VYSNNTININGLNIMVTLISVYFEYIKILCKIFITYIVPIFQVYPNHLIIFLKIINIILYYIILLYELHVIKNKFSNILLHNDHNDDDDDDVTMIGKITITEIITKSFIYYFYIIILFSND